MIADNTYYSIFINAIEGIFQSTPDGHYLNVNPSLARMYGYDSPSELMSTVTNIASQLYVDPNRRQQFIDEMAAKGIVKDFVSQVYTRDHKKKWISENVRIVRDENNSILYYEGFITDITQLKVSEDRNKTLQKRLIQSEKMETLGTMASGIAHDFNNILSPIIGYSELLLEMVPGGGKVETYLQNLLKSATRARDMVKQIHTFGRPEMLDSKPMHMQGIVSEVISFLSVTLPSTIHIQKKMSNECPRIKGDPTQMHQILMNLCTNAIHAMEDKGGTLTIKLREKYFTEKDIQMKCLNFTPGQYVDLTVSDTGEGIPANILHKIFEPYFTTKEKGKGTGLGLATVHSIIKSYKGEIIVKSEPGKGTLFHIYLPVYTAKVIQEMNTTLPIKNADKKHVMLVDDDEDVLQIERQLLELLGFKVTPFKDSQKALSSFNKQPRSFDIVLTDMNMPDMTGIDLSRSLLSINSHVPIILCTGYCESVTEKDILSTGIKKLLLKPLTTQKLSNYLGMYIN